jgi:predicted metal-dependent peptidase
MNLMREISASLLRLQLRSPFFATIALHARFVESTDIPTMATDGRDVFVNAEFAASLSREHLDGVLLHEVLHAALGHVTRRGTRDPQLWNVAADIVVNGLVLGNRFELPEGALHEADKQDYSAEEIYAILSKSPKAYPEVTIDLLEPSPGGDGPGTRPPSDGAGRDKNTSGKEAATAGSEPGEPGGAMSQTRRKAIDEHWRKANAQAAAIARTTDKGSLPVGVDRHFGQATEATHDWRSLLWHFLSPSATDFAAFDRRHIHSGLYLETLEDQALRIAVCIDTSGSVDEELLRVFTGELQAVLGAYPAVSCWLYYADAAVYGPWIIGPNDEIPVPQGGGGTDFRPFFAALEAGSDDADGRPNVALYMTDGYGDFPEPQEIPVLWAVTPGGLDSESFPFGTVVRLIE